MPSDVDLTFDTTASTVFEVNRDARTIRGLVVPFNVVGENRLGKFMFSEDTEFSWPADLTRVKFTYPGHDETSPIGYATELTRTPLGIVGAFKIARGPKGDEALMAAEDHTYDGLSMGLARAATFALKGGIQYGVKAPIGHVAQTPTPAFDDARVTSVAASAAQTTNRKESAMPDENTDETKAETPKGFDAVAFAKQIEDGIAAKFEAFTKTLPTIPPREPNPTAATGVREELPYRFDGREGGKYSLLGDAMAIQFGADSEAAKRMETFLSVAFEAIAVADVDELNPVENKPEMYVGPLRYNRPLWGMVSTGGISNATPFMMPKFGVKTGKGIQNHVEGTEPTEMKFTTDKQTVTPSALSGIAIINREVYDQGGNPSLDKIIWDEMMADYFENLENEIAALLATGTGAAINLGGGATAADKVALLKAGLVALQFTKGGDRFSQFAGDATLFGGLAGATDTTGRPLLPVVNATNADGTVRAGYESIQVGNRTVVPAWALTGNISRLFARESVYAWVSAPRRIDLQLAVKEVRIGVWGYKAAASTRLTDVIPVDWNTAA